ncbi:MAG: N-acetylmuramoyl-L-alanine amidase [Firmicutes bacterium]|nr:N-acetylmuramoyl-L-alanine amidase [Bacillota bacterium]
MPGGKILLNGRVWQDAVKIEERDGVIMVPFYIGKQLGDHTNRQLDFDHPIILSDRGGGGGDCVWLSVSAVTHHLDLRWTYLAKSRILILSREEPALRGRRIVLDAGPGNEGAGSSIGKQTEADLNRDTTRKLANILRLSGALVCCTRIAGEQAVLEKRLKAANNFRPDIFISIHQNSFFNEQVNGTEIYWYSNWAAFNLAQHIQTHLLAELGTINRGVREAAFSLLRYVEGVPVLLKLGFVSGQEDRAVIGDPWMRQKAALGIFRGVREYFEENLA